MNGFNPVDCLKVRHVVESHVSQLGEEQAKQVPS